MFLDDSKTGIHMITPNDTPLHKVERIPSGSSAMSKRSSAPERLVKSPFLDSKNSDYDSSPTLPVRRYSMQKSETVKGALEMKSDFISKLMELDGSIQDDFDDLDSIRSTVSDITNPTIFLSIERTDSTQSIDTYYTEIEYDRLDSSSGSKDLPPRPVARELTACSQDSFISSVENNPASSASPPPMPPPPRPFITEQNAPVESQNIPTSERDEEVPDNDTPPVPFLRRLTERSIRVDLDIPPVPFLRRLTESSIRVDQIFDDSSTEDSIQKQRIERPQSSSLTKLAIAFLENVTVGTNYHLLKKYETSFVGRDAVDFMLESGFACTREDAVFLGQRLQMELNLFYHVSRDHSFKDGDYFYRFTDTTDECVSEHPNISSLDLLKVADVFERDIRVASHCQYFMKFKSTFVGSEAVDYLVRSGLANHRKHAVFLGQRLLKDLNLFHHVAHLHQFKDANLFYRFSRRWDCDSTSRTSDDVSSTSTSSSLMAPQKEGKSTQDMRPMLAKVSSSLRGFPLRPSLRLASSEFNQGSSRTVTFGSVDERVYERTLRIHPSTRAGPSLGLGWNYEDKVSVPISDVEPSKVSHRPRRIFNCPEVPKEHSR